MLGLMTPLSLSRSLLLAAALPAVLSACHAPGTRAPDTYDLSGHISGEWPAPAQDARLRLALVGTGFPGVLTNQANLPQSVTLETAADAAEPRWIYGVDLPALPSAAGVYQVIAYSDQDGSGTYSLGEPLARGSQWLVYSVAGGTLPEQTLPGGVTTPALQVRAGWNVYDAALGLTPGNPRPFEKLSGYDLRRN